MLVNKITTGFVVQVFDTEKKKFISQEFVGGDPVESTRVTWSLYKFTYETQDGKPVKSELLEVDGQEVYLPFEMVQPEQPSIVIPLRAQLRDDWEGSGSKRNLKCFRQYVKEMSEDPNGILRNAAKEYRKQMKF